MSRINTNVAAIRAIRIAGINQGDLQTRLQRLSTGLRINRGADDPAGLIASEVLRAEISATKQSLSNSVRAKNVISTTEAALQEASALLLDLQSLIIEAANEAGLSDPEVAANQLAIDSILASIDRIGETTTFGGQKLLNGNKSYLTSGVTPTALASVELFSVALSENATRDIVVRVTQSAQTAQVAIEGSNTTGLSTTSATTVEIRGESGAQLFSFSSGTSLADIRDGINNVTALTGVSAVVSAVAAGTAASAILINSTTFGSDAFVSVSPISGNFIAASTANTTTRNAGVDAGVLIDGQLASVQGLRADVRSLGVDARINLSQAFGQTLSSATFAVTGGGGIFQLTPEVKPNGRLYFGFARLATTQLGNPVVGRLNTLRSGGGNELNSKNFLSAQKIVDEAISQVSSFRGRLGSIERDHLDSNLSSQGVALENLTASESVIRDADIAAEVSALTRAQILVQSTQNTLQIANSVPNLVLSLLG